MQRKGHTNDVSAASCRLPVEGLPHIIIQMCIGCKWISAVQGRNREGKLEAIFLFFFEEALVSQVAPLHKAKQKEQYAEMSAQSIVTEPRPSLQTADAHNRLNSMLTNRGSHG